MTSRRCRICLITPGHVSSTPRIVKEAEALAEAGYDVRLVASSHYPPVEPLDEAVLARANWQTTCVRTHAGPHAMLGRLRRRWLRRFRPAVEQLTLQQALRLHYPGLAQLVSAAVATEADFFHGHCVAGLAAAAQAAARRGVPYGFDAEDFHEAETVEVERDPFEGAVIRRVLGAYLCKASLLTAAAPLIADEFARRNGVQMQVILNVFPRRDAPAAPVARPPVSNANPLRLYWFSQTIGPGRGIEQMLAVAGKMKLPVELHLRGFAPEPNVAQLQAVAVKTGATERLKFLPPGKPDDMVRLAADSDLGLSIEESVPLNRDLCLTNKIFVYLLAGVPQLMSRTSAQTAMARELGEAALLSNIHDAEGTARLLDNFFTDAIRVEKARRKAGELATNRYCWEVEKRAWLAAVERAVGKNHAS